MLNDIKEYITDEMRYSRTLRNSVYGIIAVLTIAFVITAVTIIAPIVEPTYAYVGQVTDVKVHEKESVIKVNSLITRSKTNLFYGDYKEPWTHIDDSSLLNNKKMATSFNKSFSFKTKDRVDVSVGDIVKFYAKGSKIKEFVEVNSQDHINATRYVIRGELVGYETVKGTMFDTVPTHYELEFKAKNIQVKDGKKKTKLKISNEEFASLDLKTGNKYEVTKEYDFQNRTHSNWTFKEIE